MARTSLESRLIEQSDMIIQLNKTIFSLQQTIENFNTKEAALREQNDYLIKNSLENPVKKNSGLWKDK